MEKKNIKNKDNIEIQVKFEYSNNNDLLERSKEYKVKISLNEKTDFETNKNKIISGSNFRTKKERENYHMFNKLKNKFLTKNEDFISYIETKTPIILINCYEYCDKVVKKLKEETNTFLFKEKNYKSNEIKKNELKNELICLENNFEVDIFADEFIFKKGMDILLELIKENCGDLRHYALKGMNKLLSFESAFDFFNKNENNTNTLFTAFIGNNEIENVFVFYDLIIKLIGGNEQKIMSLMNLCDIYFYQKTIKFLDEDNKDNEAKNYILFFLNMILNYSDKKAQYELIMEIINLGIFDYLEKIEKNDENILSEQIGLFEDSVGKIMETIDEDSKKYKIINQKYKDYIENKKTIFIYKLIIKADSENEEIKNNAIQELNNLLKENKNNLDLIYETYIKNESTDKVKSFYNYFLVLFSEKNYILNFFNSVKNYSEKIKSKPFNNLIKILTNNKISNAIKIDTFSFINKSLTKLLELSFNQEYLEFLYLLTDVGIFELLEKESFKKEENLSKEGKNFLNIVENNLEKISSEKKYEIIKNKFEAINENIIKKQINDLLLQMHNSACEKHMIIASKLIELIKSENNFKIFFKVFMENDIKNLFYSFFEIFTLFCGGKDDLCLRFIQNCDEYEKKYKSNGLEKIVIYLDIYQNELVQLNALKLINCILSIKDKKMSYKILNKLYNLNMFEYINKLLIKGREKGNESDIKIKIIVLFAFIEEILKQNKNEKNHNEVNKNFEKLKENKQFYETTMDDFVIFDG